MEAKTRRVEANRLVLKKAGTHAEVARVLGYGDRRNVWPWTNDLRPFPPQHCVTIERVYGISRRILRPDDWKQHWPELDRRKTARA